MAQAGIKGPAACCGGADARRPNTPVHWSTEVKRLQDQVHRSASPCGCVAATLGAALAAAAWACGRLWPDANMPAGLASPLAGAGVVLASAVVGKIVGILLGRWRHGVLSQQLRRRMASEGSHKGPAPPTATTHGGERHDFMWPYL